MDQCRNNFGSWLVHTPPAHYKAISSIQLFISKYRQSHVILASLPFLG